MTKRQKRLIAAAIALALVLLGLLFYASYYRATHKLTFDLTASTSGVVDPPQFLYAFSGTGAERMQRPIGVTVYKNEVFVADAVRHRISVFNEDGDMLRSFGTSETIVPLYVARNPKDGNLYVSDRRARKVLKFTLQGKYLGEFKPNLPKNQLPKFDTKGVQWAPVAIAFADDGRMYVTELLKGHRLLIFGPDGKFKRSVGDAGMVKDAKAGKGVFQFPNSIKVFGNELYVSDSNNRRVQVFNLDGTYKRTIVTQGLPRGLAFLQRFPSDEQKTPDRFVVVDTLAHDGTLWSEKGDKILSFGEQGVLDGQFSYPDDVSVGSKNKIFITDTANGRVQVWGWPAILPPVPIPSIGPNWWLCLLPLLLLPLLLLLRKKKFLATADFVERMVDVEKIDQLPGGRRKWLATPDDYDAPIKDIVVGDVDLGQLFSEAEHSESDAQALMDKYEITREDAVTLAIAQRAKVFCTESPELRRLAKVLELDVVNAEEYLERFAKKNPRDSRPAGPEA